MSKLEAEKVDLNLMTVNLVKVVEEAFVLFKQSASKKGLTYRPELSGKEIFCLVDPVLIHNVLNNIINNSVKFTSEGEISISTGTSSGNAFIRISDTGIGIKQEDLPLIREDFRQASVGMGRKYEGTGLSIAKKYTELMGGVITVNSVYGKGTTFEICFPVSVSLPSASVENRRTKLMKRAKIYTSLQLLYVEDDPIATNYIGMIDTAGYFFNYAGDANEALLITGEKKIDIFLININLRRGDDGIVLAKKIRAMGQYAAAPIVAVTAYAIRPL